MIFWFNILCKQQIVVGNNAKRGEMNAGESCDIEKEKDRNEQHILDNSYTYAKWTDEIRIYAQNRKRKAGTCDVHSIHFVGESFSFNNQLS